ncbi:MAG TPA: tRNA pseudouridine(38-40) synthase TruA [Thermodesulfovibrionales bacterium]|nr:tRNA pseudouridine(38-40) synthase TruA [Thermodesulfovibrionales bacterium]
MTRTRLEPLDKGVKRKPLRRIRLAVQYDGTAYNGWQAQPSGTTIQRTLEKSIQKITGDTVSLIGAGRTDAGVHAVEQVASFDSATKLDTTVLKRALNAVLPEDVRVFAVEDVQTDFHPRYSALRKRYVYLIANMEIGSVPVFLKRYVWQISVPLRAAEMKRAADYLCGRHDFSSFRGTGCGARSPVREVYAIDVQGFDEIHFLCARFSGTFLKIAIEADAFLRHMVRNIVGTLVEVGRGKLTPQDIRGILEARDRKCAGPTAPAKGLFLDRVIYPL